jgi:ABC-2 type transport system permease protein
MKAVAIAATDTRRLLRWRANVFFLFVLPMLIILLLGAAFGGSASARLGILELDHGPLAQRFVQALRTRPSTTLVTYRSAGDLRHAVSVGDVDAGLVVPATYDAQLTAATTATIAYVGRPNSVAQQLRATVQSVAASEATTLAAAQALTRQRAMPFTQALGHATAVAAVTPRVVVRLTAPGGSVFSTASGRIDQSASTELVLFIFLNSLNGAAWLIETRRLGIARRMLSTPTSTRTIVSGEVLGRLIVALLQAVIIVLGSVVLFGVNWGNPIGAAGVIVSFALVSTGAAILLGSLFSSEQQSGPVALLLGLGLAALGGSMAPLEVFPPAARAIAHITPHAWANEAFSKLVKHGGDLASVLPQIAVLLAFAAVSLTLAVWQLRRTLTQ